ncbi:restriction endonuclease subunit S [Streptomyces sp. LZ34]
MEIRLADVLRSPLASGRPKTSDANGGWPVLRPTALAGAKVDCRDANQSDGSAGRGAPVLAREGDFLVCRSSGVLHRLGRGALVGDGSVPVALPDSMTRIRVRPEVLNPEYLGHLWQSSRVREQIEACAGSGRMRSLSMRALRDIRLPLPPLTEQHRIVVILRERLQRIDRGNDALRRAAAGITALQDAAHNALTPGCDMFLGSIPHGWSWGRLGDVINVIEAGRSLEHDGRPARGDEWGVIKTSAVTQGAFLETENKAVRAGVRVDERHEIKAGDILLCRANSPDHVGASVCVTACRPRLLLSDKSLRLVPERNVDGRWLVQLLATSYVRTQIAQRSSGTLRSMRNISQSNLRDIPIPIAPPCEQERLGRKATAWNQGAHRLSSRVQRALETSDELRQALADAACTGRLVRSAVAGTPQEESAMPIRSGPSPCGEDSVGRSGRVPAPRAAAHPHTKTFAAVQLELEL